MKRRPGERSPPCSQAGQDYGGSRILPRGRSSPIRREKIHGSQQTTAPKLWCAQPDRRHVPLYFLRRLQPWAGASWPHTSRPLMKILALFTAPNVPQIGPAEIAVPPAQATIAETHPARPARQGTGAAPHALHRRRLQQDVPRQRRQDHLDLLHRPRQRIRRRLDAFQRQHSLHAHAIRRRGHAQERRSSGATMPRQERKSTPASRSAWTRSCSSRTACRPS